MNTYYIGVIIKWIYYTSTKYIYLYQLREATKLNCWHAKRARKGRCPNDDQSIIPPWTCWPASPKNSHDRWRRLTARSAHTCNRDRLRHSSSTSIFCIFFFLALSFNTGEREQTIKYVYVCRCCIDSRASGTRISTAQVCGRRKEFAFDRYFRVAYIIIIVHVKCKYGIPRQHFVIAPHTNKIYTKLAIQWNAGFIWYRGVERWSNGQRGQLVLVWFDQLSRTIQSTHIHRLTGSHVRVSYNYSLYLATQHRIAVDCCTRTQTHTRNYTQTHTKSNESIKCNKCSFISTNKIATTINEFVFMTLFFQIAFTLTNLQHFH